MKSPSIARFKEAQVPSAMIVAWSKLSHCFTCIMDKRDQTQYFLGRVLGFFLLFAGWGGDTQSSLYLGNLNSQTFALPSFFEKSSSYARKFPLGFLGKTFEGLFPNSVFVGGGA